MRRAAIIVPCFNERSRLPVSRFASFAQSESPFDLLFVDDGSTDGTAEQIAAIPGARLLRLPLNQGKGEAVRRGVLLCARDYQQIGFLDADLATPLSAMAQFADLLEQRPDLDIITGARVLLCGRVIKRNPMRHYLGRVLATATAHFLALPVYDTQCGAKLFRVTSEWEQLWAAPFLSRWLFDVELFARYQHYGQRPLQQRLYEFPLEEWRDQGPSKVRAVDVARIPWELVGLCRRYRFGPGALVQRSFATKGPSTVPER
jgi:glycosyltransferase involved in cell wall biosynthesis